jgi:hypothetical protein
LDQHGLKDFKVLDPCCVTSCTTFSWHSRATG